MIRSRHMLITSSFTRKGRVNRVLSVGLLSKGTLYQISSYNIILPLKKFIPFTESPTYTTYPEPKIQKKNYKLNLVLALL